LRNRAERDLDERGRRRDLGPPKTERLRQRQHAFFEIGRGVARAVTVAREPEQELDGGLTRQLEPSPLDGLRFF
jgi:hypothetical protein